MGRGTDVGHRRGSGLRHRRAIAASAALALVLASCSDDDTSAPSTAASTTPAGEDVTTTAAPSTVPPTEAPTTTIAPPDWSATITRTEYGIPHIVADDWGSLGFGQGYAYAQDRACTLIDQVIKVRGERSQWYGPGEDDEYLNSDLAYRHLHLHDGADEKFADQPDDLAALIEGYVAGFNAELADEGPHGWCEDQPWVQPITTTDLYAYLNDVLLFASSGVLLDQIATAEPPTAATGETSDTGDTGDTDGTDGETAGGALGLERGELASNGWAIGSEVSASGGGMLLANPHFPWEGEKRLWESQLTLTTGELDVYGATLSGVPGVLIGFNDSVAWTHTVSAGYRMTLYELTLVPGDPTSFVYGDTTEALVPEDITVDVLQADGTAAPVTRTMWSSHYGPMLNLPTGWTDTLAYTMRDANANNTDFLAQWFGMAQAGSMDEFVDVQRTANGVPWVNTVATSADGQAWYADTSATPNLSPEAIAGWQQAVADGGLAATFLDSGAILLDGSNPANEWVDDPAATRAGILPFDAQPQLLREDYVFNANDSHWLANPAELLTGYSPLTGAEGVPQSARTRMNAILLADPAVRGDDGRVSLEDLQAAWTSGRALHAELLRDQVVATCERTSLVLVDEVPYDIAPACAVLRDWDGRTNVDSIGAVLWREYLVHFSGDDRKDAGALYLEPFDPADPVGTPNTLNDDSDQAVLTPLGLAANALARAGIALDTPLGDLQHDGRVVDDPLPLPGGTNLEGAASIVDCCSNPRTMAPTGSSGTQVDGQYLSDLGYPITYGNSFVMTLEFTDDGPHAEAVLTYGQPDDPEDPDFTSQMELYASGSFRPIAFTAAEVAAAVVGEPATVTGYR